MPPSAVDLAIARAVAQRLIAQGKNQIRLIAMIGSRATGHARETSDLDLVTVVELPPDEPRWNGPHADAEKMRLIQAIGPVPVELDLSVRSGEQYEEAREIVGGVEKLVAQEGCIIFSQPFSNAPKRTRTRVAVTTHLVRAWLEASARSIALGIRASQEKVAVPSLDGWHSVHRYGHVGTALEESGLRITLRRTVSNMRGADHYWRRAVQQALTAVCVLHQIDSSKHDALASVVSSIAKRSPHAGRQFEPLVESQPSRQHACVALDLAIRLISSLEQRTKTVVDIRRRLLEWRMP
jgi:predicted nucleotidyltransferase